MTRPPAQLNRFFISSDYSVYYRRAKQFHWQSQATPGYSLLNVLHGSLANVSDGQVVELPAKSALVVEPNADITVTGKQVELLQLTVSPSLLIEHALAMRLIPPKSTVSFAPGPIEGDHRLENLLQEFVAELLNEDPGKEIVMRALVEQVVVHLLRNYSQPRRSHELELSRAGLIDRRIRRSVELMHTQLDQDLSLKALAAASYLSPFHFARLFKKLTGSTPHNYLAVIRTNRAQLLLAETELSITEIGARVGYLSASHFTKAFRLATGTTPREFRKALITR
jgi:AraC family transcriptional regulator